MALTSHRISKRIVLLLKAVRLLETLLQIRWPEWQCIPPEQASSSGLLQENGFGHHHVHAFVAVDQLGNVNVTGYAGQHVSIVTAEVLLAHKKVNHLAHGDARGLVQLLMKTH